MSDAAPPPWVHKAEVRELARLLFEWHVEETARRRAAWDACLARGGSPSAEGLPRPSWLHD